jgi:hypothetical protein
MDTQERALGIKRIKVAPKEKTMIFPIPSGPINIERITEIINTQELNKLEDLVAVFDANLKEVNYSNGTVTFYIKGI